MAVPTEMNLVGLKWGFNGVKKYAHGGMLRSADHIRTEIEEKCLLDGLYGDCGRCGSGGSGCDGDIGDGGDIEGGCGTNRYNSSGYTGNNTPNTTNHTTNHNHNHMNTPLFASESTSQKYCHYRLVITGHSLGAATAILLAMMLKPKYNNVQCITYG